MHMNDENIAKAEAVDSRCRELFSQHKADEAVALARDLLLLDAEDVNVCKVASGNLIDAAGILDDLGLAQQGIEIIQKMLSEFPQELASEEELNDLRFNLANGFDVKHKWYRERGEEIETAECLQHVKNLLQTVLLRREHVYEELQPAVFANYANLLDHLHRPFEAIDQYMDCLDLSPDHGLAKGNCASVVRRIASLSDQHHIDNIQACRDLSSDAVGNPESVTAWASPKDFSQLVDQRIDLEKEIKHRIAGGVATVEEHGRHRRTDHAALPIPTWAEEIRRDRLFLTFNAIPLNSIHECLDDAFFDRLRYEPGEKGKRDSIELIHLFSSIKEEFVTARHLFYQAKNFSPELLLRNEIAFYGDPEGGAEFGLVSGVLKTSFRLAVDLMDKVAVFLVLYFGLGGPIDNLNFNNFWFKDRKPKNGVLHPILELKIKDNYSLLGLRDIQRDFFRQEFPAPIKNARNAAVHRWLRLSWLPLEKDSRADSAWNLDDFYHVTLFVLRQAKAVILLLAAIVNFEEKRRAAGDASGKLVMQVPFDIQKPISCRAADGMPAEALASEAGRSVVAAADPVEKAP